MKKIVQLFSFISMMFFVTKVANAHVKWFAHETIVTPNYVITDFPVLLSIIVVCGIVCFGIYMERNISLPVTLHAIIQKIAPKVLSIASIGFGLAFLIFSFKGFIFAPNILPQGTLGQIMLVIQVVLGFMILFGVYERIGGFLLLVLFGLGIYEYGFIEMLDTLEMVGFGLYAMIVGRPLWKIVDTSLCKNTFHKLHAYGYPLLRVGTGLNLIILGFSEKILAPSLTQNFLSQYHWNFMETFGMSNYWFAYGAGVVEVTFGIFFLFGLITRTTTLVLAVFLIITLYLLGPVELIGHLPHFSIAVVLLVFGSGNRLLLIKQKT